MRGRNRAPAHNLNASEALAASPDPSPQPNATARGKRYPTPKPGTAAAAMAQAVAKSQAKGAGDGAVGVRVRVRTPGAQPDSDAEFERNTQQALASAEALAREQRLLDTAPTHDSAEQLAKLVRAGVPQPDAIQHLLGPMPAPLAELVLQRWMHDPLVLTAFATLNGGRWPDLDHDKRLDIALTKHDAELAHYLYTHDYESADGIELKKMEAARETLERRRVGAMEQSSPFARFIASMLKGEVAVVPQRQLAPGERDSVLGLADVEPVVEGEVAPASDEA